jgi:hypothetical protein
MGLIASLTGIFGCSKIEELKPIDDSDLLFVTAQLNHPLMPLDRGDRYEDPLDEALSAEGLGHTDGGGTMQSESGEIEFIDVEIALTDEEKGIPFVISKLEEMGTPVGSILKIHDSEPSREIPFGKVEGLAIYLDGVNLPDEVYQDSDVNVVIDELNESIVGHGDMQSHWQGNTETALYFYGDDQKKMAELMKGFLDTYPLCKGARIVQLAPKPPKD